MIKRLLACLLAVCMLLSSGILSVTADTTPGKEDKEEMLTMTIGTGLLKVDVIAANNLRVRYFPGGEIVEEDLNTFTVDYDKSFHDFTVTETGNILTVLTEKLQVLIDKSTGKITYNTASGELILEENARTNKQITLDDGVKTYEVAQEFHSDANEALYGFGNINATMGIKGQSVNIDQGNTNKRTPMFYSNMGYGILFDITSNGKLEWSNGNSLYKYTGYASDSMDYFFFYGPDADTVISGYRTVTGKATMLPKNAFGYVQSRNRYGSQNEIQTVLNTFREKKIPLDTLVIDYHWWEGDFNNITKWNSNWPDPAAMMDYFHENNITASISVWPSFKSGTAAYDIMNNAGYLMPTDSGFGYTYDPTSQSARDTYWGMINDTVFSKGMDSIWLDACEPENSKWARNNGSEPTAWGNSKPIGALYPLLTNKAVYEGQRSITTNTKRVNTLTRGSVAGIQRYGGQSWSGDIPSTWDQLGKEISGVINYSAAGLPYFCTDTGGYHGFNNSDPSDREMYFRWLQFSTFNTIMRSHGASNPREPWQFGATYEGYITDYIYFRERLVPYTYALAGAVTQEDYTIVRPLIFDFRTDDNVKHIQDQFMYGPSLMVAPIAKEGQRSRTVYLPAGNWTNFWTGETIASTGEEITVAAPLTQIPLFVRGGSILPLAPENEWVDQSQDPTEIRVYMGADGKFNLYEDEGDGYDYEKGEFSNIPFAYDDTTKTLTIGERTGSFDGMLTNRTFKVVFVQPGYGIGMGLSSDYQETATVAYDGTEVSVTFDADWEIPTPPLDTALLPKPDAAPDMKASEQAMVGYWPFREGEGAKVVDDSGYFNSGALNLSHWTANGKEGNAIQFSGGSATTVGTFVQVPDKDSLDMTTAISFSAWVKNESGGYGNIVNKGGNAFDNPGYSFILHGDTLLQLEIQSDKVGGKTQKTTAKSTVNVPKDGQWHQVGFTWKSEDVGGDGIVRIYVDGVQTTDDANTANYFAGPIGTNAYPLILGRSCENEPHSPNYFKGTMDECRLFNYELTADDMAKLNKSENILVANPTDAAAIPGDGKLTLSWADAADTASIDVLIETVDTEYSEKPIRKTVTVEKGVQTLTVDGLVNGEYYYITLTSKNAEGKTSSGLNMVAMPNATPARVDANYVVTHGNDLYAWVENLSSTPLEGNLVITLTEGDAEKETLTIPVSVAGNENLQVSKALTTDFASGQTLTLTVKDAEGNALSNTATLTRSAYYVERPTADKSALQIQLKIKVDLTKYTPETAAVYEAAYKTARLVEHNKNSTQEEVNAALTALKEAKRGLKRKSSDGIVATFPNAEGTTSRLLGGNIYYIDWNSADGLPGGDGDHFEGIDMSGSAANGADPNLHFKATVIFTSLDGKTDPAGVWREFRFRLRSSRIDGQEKASSFITIKPSDLDSPDMFEIDVPLSDFGSYEGEYGEHTGIDWTDVKQLIVQCFVNDEYKLPGDGESPACSMTLADVWIENVSQGTQPAVDKTALNAAIDAADKLDLAGYTEASAKAFGEALAVAKAAASAEDATAEQVTAALSALEGAQAALTKVMLGDVDGDKNVAAADALLALQIATNKVTPTADQVTAANVDGSAGVAANDALLILQLATKKISSF